MKKDSLKPVRELYSLRKAVSEILGIPFTERIDHQAFKPHQKTLALWAVDCAERVLPYFEAKYPADPRPRQAVEALRSWLTTGIFKMAVIRTKSLSAHAAAKGRSELDAVYAAHSAGQAVGTAHVATHALGAALYAIRAVAAHSGNIEDGTVKERNWQLSHLREYAERSSQRV